MRYRFGKLELDTEAYTLTRSGRAVAIRPKVFDLLRFLIEQRARMVTKEELLDTLWEGEHVSEAVLPWAVGHARRALGQKTRAKTPIETIYSRGYRWRAPIEIVQERAASIAPARTAAEPTREARPFVGRAELMESLRERLASAQAGRGGLCLLVGEAGIGKTRCMDELTAIAASLGFSVWSGRATEDAWAPALWPWTEVLRSAVAERGARDRAGELLARSSAAATMTSEPDASAAGAGQRSSFGLFDDLSRFLLQASQRRPLLVLLDDLHWADAGTIALLTAIAPELRRHPLLIVAAQRDQAREYRVRRPLQLARHAELIELGPLTTADVTQYIGLVTSVGSPDTALSAAVHSASAGNALFLQETVRALISQHGASGLLTLSPAQVRPPPLARDVLRERLGVLSPDVRSLLATASVLGESFETDLLQKVSRQPIQALISALDEALGAGLIGAEGVQRFRFCHALVRSVLYDELSAQVRIATHRSAAEAIEGMSHVAPRQRELAHHYYRSLALGQPRIVVTAVRKAAEEAMRSREFEDAAAFSQWALEAQAIDVSASAPSCSCCARVRHAARASSVTRARRSRSSWTKRSDTASRI